MVHWHVHCLLARSGKGVFQLGLGGLQTFKDALAATQRGAYAIAAAEMLNSQRAKTGPRTSHSLAKAMESGVMPVADGIARVIRHEHTFYSHQPYAASGPRPLILRFVMKLKFRASATTLTTALLVSSSLLAACGGGGSSDGADPTATANRLRRPNSTSPASGASSTAAASAPAAASSTPASNVISITQSPYNADATGKTDSTNAIQNALTVAAQNGSSVTIPAGTFVYSNVLNVNGIALSGVGKTSILKATNFNNEAIHLTGTGGSLSNFAITTAANTRLAAWETAAVWIDAAKNFTVQGLTVTGSASAGIFNSGGQGGTIQNNTVQNTLADAITNTNGANGTVISGNLVKAAGDDGISIVSYANAPIVQNITVKNNTVTGNVGGRGLTTVGGNNITYTGNVVDNTDQYASLYIAAESEYNTFGVSNVTATGNTFIHGGPSQGTVTVYNSQGSTYNITGVNLSGNQIVSPPFVAFQFVGNGSGSGTIQNSTVYSAQGASALQNVGNSKENIPVTGTTFSPVAAYTASIAPGGAGATQ